jgi:glucitol/sorbitol PTS system EIIA component
MVGELLSLVGPKSMIEHFRTVVTQVSDEARELVESGVLILFAEGAPPELAEVSVLHVVKSSPTADSPAVGAALSLGGVETEITAIGDYAWRKIGEIGHVVINFNGAATTPRPGEICASPVDFEALNLALIPGAEISIRG